MSKEVFNTKEAPAAIGPYSQATAAGMGKTVYVSGQLGIKNGELVSGIESQTEVALTNLRSIVIATGGDLPCVVKTTVLLTDLGNFDKVNAVYAKFFPTEPPARVCYEVSGLPKGGLVEIDAIAYV